MRFISINVGGLKTKLRQPDFLDTISKFEVICLTETHLDDYDTIDIPNYQAFWKNKKAL